MRMVDASEWKMVVPVGEMRCEITYDNMAESEMFMPDMGIGSCLFLNRAKDATFDREHLGRARKYAMPPWYPRVDW